jgi:hypothetical protein
VNYQRTNSRLPEMWAGETERVLGEQTRVLGEQARVLGETERVLGEQAYEDVLATVIINKVDRLRQKVLGSISASSNIISLPAEQEFFWSSNSIYICRCEKLSIFSFGCLLKSDCGFRKRGKRKEHVPFTF